MTLEYGSITTESDAVAFTATNAAIAEGPEAGSLTITDQAVSQYGAGTLTVTLDGVEVGPTAASDVGGSIAITLGTYWGSQANPPLVAVSIQNSYFYGSSSDNPGLSISPSGASLDGVDHPRERHLRRRGCVRRVRGGTSAGGTPLSTLTVTNTLFVNAKLALSTQATTTDSYDGFYGNTTNFAGTVVPGSNLVMENPLLDTSTPPGLLPASPSRRRGPDRRPGP